MQQGIDTWSARGDRFARYLRSPGYLSNAESFDTGRSKLVARRLKDSTGEAFIPRPARASRRRVIRFHHAGSISLLDATTNTVTIRDPRRIDQMSALLVFRTEDGRPLTDFEISNSLMNLLLAGNETTTSLLTNLAWRLLEQPDRWAALAADRALVDVAIEESLRYDAAVLGLFRTSLRQVELGGVTVPAKTKIHVNYGAANRDPAVFSNPDEFRLDRPQDELRRHVAFGKGVHVCPGAQLSRLETRIALDALLDRSPTLRLAGPTSRITPFNFWGRRSIPVQW